MPHPKVFRLRYQIPRKVERESTAPPTTDEPTDAVHAERAMPKKSHKKAATPTPRENSQSIILVGKCGISDFDCVVSILYAYCTGS